MNITTLLYYCIFLLFAFSLQKSFHSIPVSYMILLLLLQVFWNKNVLISAPPPKMEINKMELESTPYVPSIAIEKDDTVYQLVLFTTEDGFSNAKQNKISLFRDMCNLFHENYSCRCILFTTTPSLIQTVKDSSIVVVTQFKYVFSFRM